MTLAAVVLSSAPQSGEGTGDAASGSAERPTSTGEISHGKNELDLQSGEIPSVACYASEIRVNWQRGVETFMNVARLCADANTRLSEAKKQELMTSLPFGQATFSKFAKFGADTRLTPEIQRLLPPRYTTMYAVSLLTNEEFDQAIVEKIIHPDLKREELEKWRREQKKSGEEARSSEQAANAPTITASEVVENDDPPLPAQPQPALQSEPPTTETNTRSPEAVPSVVGEVASPPIALLGDENAPSAVDDGPLSEDEQRAFDKLISDWNVTPKRAQDRFVCKVLGLDPSLGSARSQTEGLS